MTSSQRFLPIVATVYGNTLEWLEFTLFAYLSHKIAPHFFSADDPTVALLKTYMIFGSSYLARPLGSLFFGSMGDKLGRVKVLHHSLLLMSVSTTLMALIPSYETIGIFSPLFLVACRLLQGFSVSGEFNSSILVLIENFGERRPYAFGLLGPLSASIGMLLGALLSSLVYKDILAEQSWSYLFLFSSALGFIGYYIRRSLPESQVFLKAQKERKLVKNPPLDAIKRHTGAFFVCFFCAMFIANFVYLGSLFYETLAQKSSSLDKGTIHSAIVMGQGLASFIMLLAFLWFRKINLLNPKKLSLIALSLAFLMSPLMMTMATSQNLPLLFFGQILYGIVNGSCSSLLITYVNLQFPPETRLSGTSLAWSLGAALFGGTSLMFGEFLRAQGFTSFIGLYLSLSAFLPFIFILLFGKEEISQNSTKPFSAQNRYVSEEEISWKKETNAPIS